MIVENEIGLSVPARYSIGPEFLHEKHLISKLWHHTFSRRFRFLYPIRLSKQHQNNSYQTFANPTEKKTTHQMTDEIEEEIRFRDTDDLIGNFYE